MFDILVKTIQSKVANYFKNKSILDTIFSTAKHPTKVLYDFSGLDDQGVKYDQAIRCQAGDILYKIEDEDFDEPDNGWTKVQNIQTDESGYVPSSYVELYSD